MKIIASQNFFFRDTTTGTAKLGGSKGGMLPLTFCHICSLLRRSQTIGLPNPAKLPELQLKFDDQIAGNRTSKIFRDNSARTSLDGSRLGVLKMAPPL